MVKVNWLYQKFSLMTHSGAEPHSGMGGPWPVQKKQIFPLDYEEKIIRPPQP